MWLILLLIAVLLFAYFYKNIDKKQSYWKERNVPGPDPTFLVGNMLENMVKKKSLGQILIDIYNGYSRYPFVGVYHGTTPKLLVRDPDLIRNICVKDFKYFQNNAMEVDRELEPILARNPFVLRDEEWRQARSQLSPFFTNAKLKNLVPLIDVNSERLINYLKNNPNARNATGIEGKIACTKFTLDNVASCAFGIDGKSFEDENSEFRQIAKPFVEQDFITNFKFMILFLFPLNFLTRLLKVKFLPEVIEKKIESIVSETIEYRQKNNITRNDFLNMLLELKRQNPDEFSYMDLSGHAGSFIFDGFETSANVMNYLLHNLAYNQEAQRKLRAEIDAVKKANNGIVTYDALKDMKYLDACLNESLRTTPSVLVLSKMCNADYEYTPSNTDDFTEISIKIENGTEVFLPFGAFCWDKKYFPEPHAFKPDRFLDEDNKLPNLKYVFFPFGVGPRTCLGQAFGLLQIKLGIIALIDNFHVKPNAKTKLPLEYDAWYILQAPVGGLWFNFEPLKP